jgi:hypothetical protein
MEMRSSPQISSFVLRFVQEDSPASTAKLSYRGSIRHVQTDQEYSFSNWIDALNFMSQFIPEEVFDLPDPLSSLKPKHNLYE